MLDIFNNVVIERLDEMCSFNEHPMHWQLVPFTLISNHLNVKFDFKCRSRLVVAQIVSPLTQFKIN